jgi:hypothetical protein
MRTFRAIAAVACFGACAFGGSAAWGCDERFPASCKSKAVPARSAAVTPLEDASSAKRTERRRSARSERKARFRSGRRARIKLARLARYRRAEGREVETAARMPAEAPHRALRSRAFDPTTGFAQSGLLTPALLGGTEGTAFTGAVRPVSTAALEVQASKPIAVIAASHLLAASTSANAAEMLGMVPGKASPEELRSASLSGGWSDSGIMRVLFLTLAGLLTFGTAVRLAM